MDSAEKTAASVGLVKDVTENVENSLQQILQGLDRDRAVVSGNGCGFRL